MNRLLKAANRVFGPLGGNLDRSASPVVKINEGVYSQRGVNAAYTLPGNLDLARGRVVGHVKGQRIVGLGKRSYAAYAAVVLYLTA